MIIARITDYGTTDYVRIGLAGRRRITDCGAVAAVAVRGGSGVGSISRGSAGYGGLRPGTLALHQDGPGVLVDVGGGDNLKSLAQCDIKLLQTA